MNNREAVERILDAIRKGDAAAYADAFAADATLDHPLSEDTIAGRDQIRASEQALFSAFTDIEIDVRSLTGEGDRVVAEVVLRATNSGPIDLGEGDPAPATGARVEVRAVWLFEFGPGGLVTAERDYFDTGALMAQLGFAGG